MRDKSANVADQIPAFTTKTVRRCKMCAVLVKHHSDVVSQADARRGPTSHIQW